MLGMYGAIDCKDYTFDHGLTSKFGTGLTAIETGMLASQQLHFKEENKF
jgi:hypothetical protein